MIRIGIRNAVAAIALAGMLAGASAAAASTVTKPKVPAACQGDLSARTNGHESLDRFTYEQGDSVTDVLGLTMLCGNTPAFSRYLDHGALHKPMPAGITLWFLPAGGGSGTGG